jgi:ribulose 1,5-bisphosphate synthetase/thiazole synthase
MTNLVLIVGGGPVGMTMASELARYGVAIRIIPLIWTAPCSRWPSYWR